jgi:hypothetical protein
MNKLNNLLSTKTLSGSFNAGMDLIDPENSVLGNIVVNSEGAPSKRLKCTTTSLTSLTGGISSNTDRIENVESKTSSIYSGSNGTMFNDLIETDTGFKITNGTSSQILLANGSVDSTAFTNIANNASSIAANTATLINATNLNTASSIVKRDASGDFTAGAITSSKIILPGTASIVINSNTAGNNLIANRFGASPITGTNNCCFGLYAGQALTSGGFNSYFGFTAGRDNLAGIGNCGFGTECLQTNTGNYNVAIGVQCGCSGALDNTIAIGRFAIPTISNTCVIGNSSLTDVRTSGTYTASGFRTPTGTASGVLIANGTVNNTLLDIINWRYQASSYYGSNDQKNGTLAPTEIGVDCVFFMNHLGNVLNVGVPSDTNTKSRKYRVESKINTPLNGAVSGWLAGSTQPYLLLRQGWKVVIGFGLNDTTTNASTRSMIGLFQSTTAPILNATTTVASIPTQSMGIVQEAGENVWSFNTRGGSATSTKIATTISCQTPNTTWYVLEMTNYVNSNDIIMTLTDQDSGSATQTFTCGTLVSLSNTGLNYIQIQRNMSSASGLAGSAILQTASVRIWNSN